MSHTRKLSFHLVGQLDGYRLGQKGKVRRLLLKTEQGVQSLKLTSASRLELLQAILNKKLQQGSWVEVKGVQKIDQNGTVKLLKAKQITPILMEVIARPSLASRSAAVALPPQQGKTKILVCQKSDCCKRGSTQVQQAIENAICDRDLGDQVCVQGVGCLKHCSKGPNIIIGKTRCPNVKVKDIDQLLDQLLDRSLVPSIPIKPYAA